MSICNHRFVAQWQRWTFLMLVTCMAGCRLEGPGEAFRQAVEQVDDDAEGEFLRLRRQKCVEEGGRMVRWLEISPCVRGGRH